MISRRLFSAGAAASLVLPAFARATESRIALSGTLEQGSLVVGKTELGATVSLGGVHLRLAEDGHFAFGLAYDQKEPLRLEARFRDGSFEARDIVPVIRQYEVQSVTGLPGQFVTPSAQDEARIAQEHARVAEARQTDSDLLWFCDPFDWPAAGIVSGLFGSQRILNGVPSAPHFGVDIAGGAGAPICAPANGTVLIADQFFLEGGYTLLDHGHGVFTGYMHQSAQTVKPGDAVTRGQRIGNIGMTGRATGPHLHWQMNWFQVRLDPSRSTRTPAPAKA